MKYTKPKIEEEVIDIEPIMLQSQFTEAEETEIGD